MESWLASRGPLRSSPDGKRKTGKKRKRCEFGREKLLIPKDESEGERGWLLDGGGVKEREKGREDGC